MTDRDDELADAVRELTRTIDELRTELEDSAPRRRPSLRPPTPAELLRFTDEVALPAALAVLEASVRTLEAFQRSLTLVRGGREAGDRTTAAAEAASDRTRELRRTTLTQLDSVLSGLQRAASEGALPSDERARSLLAEARELRDDVDRRLRAVDDRESRATDRMATGSESGIEIDIEDGSLPDSDTNAESTGAGDDRDSTVDVDAELETLRDRYGADEDAATDSDASDDDSGPDGDEPDSGENTDGGVDP